MKSREFPTPFRLKSNQSGNMVVKQLKTPSIRAVFDTSVYSLHSFETPALVNPDFIPAGTELALKGDAPAVGGSAVNTLFAKSKRHASSKGAEDSVAEVAAPDLVPLQA